MKSILSLFLVIVLFSCNKDQGNQEGDKTTAKDNTGIVRLSSEQTAAIGIKFGNLEKKNLTNIIRANGLLELPPQNQASINSYIGGVIKEIDVIPGDHVEKGQKLAVLEHPDIVQMQEDYLKAKSEFAFTEREYERQKELYKENIVSGKKFQQAEAQYKSQKALLQSLENKLSIIGISPANVANGHMVRSVIIKSPISGYVHHVDVSIGSFVDPAKEIFSIVDISHIHVDLQVYEKDISKIREGQKVFFTLADSSSQEWEAKIFKIGKSLDPAHRSISVHADIVSDKNKNLLPGRYVSARIELGEDKVDALPSDAIIKEGELSYIFVKSASNDTSGQVSFRRTEVKTGASDQGYTAVKMISPLGQGEQIVIKGAYYLMAQLQKDQSGGEEE